MPQLGFHQLPCPLHDHRPRRNQRYVTPYSEPQHQALLILPRPCIAITAQADAFLIREEHRAGPFDVTTDWERIYPVHLRWRNSVATSMAITETSLPANGGVLVTWVTVSSGNPSPVVDGTKNGSVHAVEVDAELERHLQRAVVDESGQY